MYERVNRENVLIKIPATIEGLEAITETIAAGISVNVTLIFSLERYREAVACYQQATTYASDDPWFWYNFGEALMRLGDTEGAKAKYQSALKADPRHQASKDRLHDL